jgi:hypothetical protein
VGAEVAFAPEKVFVTPADVEREDVELVIVEEDEVDDFELDINELGMRVECLDGLGTGTVVIKTRPPEVPLGGIRMTVST